MALGGGVFMIAYSHIVELATYAGQPHWAALIIAFTGEAMAAGPGWS